MSVNGKVRAFLKSSCQDGGSIVDITPLQMVLGINLVGEKFKIGYQNVLIEERHTRLAEDGKLEIYYHPAEEPIPETWVELFHWMQKFDRTTMFYQKSQLVFG